MDDGMGWDEAKRGQWGVLGMAMYPFCGTTDWDHRLGNRPVGTVRTWEDKQQATVGNLVRDHCSQTEQHQTDVRLERVGGVPRPQSQNVCSPVAMRLDMT
jgi:hypothetical protein